MKVSFVLRLATFTVPWFRLVFEVMGLASKLASKLVHSFFVESMGTVALRPGHAHSNAIERQARHALKHGRSSAHALEHCASLRLCAPSPHQPSSRMANRARELFLTSCSEHRGRGFLDCSTVEPTKFSHGGLHVSFRLRTLFAKDFQESCQKSVWGAPVDDVFDRCG